MERIVRPISDGGAPYLNQDFFKILQENNLKSYRSFLDTANDQYGKKGNSGIIVKGVKVTGNTFDLSDSMVYIDGEFMELLPSFPKTYTATGGTNKLYLVVTTTFEDREAKVTGLPVGFIRADQVTLTKDQETHTLVNYYYTIDTQISSESFIEFEFKNGEWITSRYMDRILKYHTSDFGQILMTTNVNYFDPVTGKGFGPMQGFQWCWKDDGIVVSSSTPLQHNQKTIDLKGKFLINFDSSSIATPFNNQNDYIIPNAIKNYKKLYNKGGFDNIFLYSTMISSHDHSKFTGFASNQLTHYHEMEVTKPLLDSDIQSVVSSLDPGNPAIYIPVPIFGKGKKLQPWTNTVTNFQFDEPYPSRTIETEWTPRPTYTYDPNGTIYLQEEQNQYQGRVTVNQESRVYNNYMRGNLWFDDGSLYKPERWGPNGITNWEFYADPRGGGAGSGLFVQQDFPQFANRWKHTGLTSFSPQFLPLTTPTRTLDIVYAKGDGNRMTFRIRKYNTKLSDSYYQEWDNWRHTSQTFDQNLTPYNLRWGRGSDENFYERYFFLNKRNFNETFFGQPTGNYRMTDPVDGTSVKLSGFTSPYNFLNNLIGIWTFGPIEPATWTSGTKNTDFYNPQLSPGNITVSELFDGLATIPEDRRGYWDPTAKWGPANGSTFGGQYPKSLAPPLGNNMYMWAENSGIFEFYIDGTYSFEVGDPDGEEIYDINNNLVTAVPAIGQVTYVAQIFNPLGLFGVSDADPISEHTHDILGDTSERQHPNLPPHYDVIYYEKIPAI